MTDATRYLPGLDERSVVVRGTRLRYFVGGSGPPLILVHGFSGAASNWADLAPALARTRRILVPDLPGHGGSAPLPAAPNLDVFADCVAALAERESMVPADVAGHSLGGAVAVRLAVRRSAHVRRLVLLASAGIGSATRSAEVWLNFFGVVRPGRRLGRLRSLIAARPRLRLPVFGPWSVSDGTALSELGTLGLLAGPELHTDTLSAGRALTRDDTRLDLERIACPSLVLWGARDRQVPIGDAFEYARRVRAPLRVIPDCGHLLIGERPDACLDAISIFLG